MLAWCSMLISFYFDKQHDLCQKKCFDPPPGAGDVCKDRICACMVSIFHSL